MIKDLSILRSLQSIDLEIDSISESQIRLPEKVQAQKLNLESQKNKLIEKKEYLTSLQKKCRELEGDLRVNEDKNRGAQKKMMSVTNSQELHAMEKEIELAKRENGLLEEQILEALLRVDHEKEEEQGLEKEVEHQSMRLEEDIKQAEEIKIELDRKLNEKRGVREEKEKELSLEILQRYQRLRKQYSLAVAQIRQAKCSGCDMSLPPQLENEVKKEAGIYECPSCQRMLVISENSA